MRKSHGAIVVAPQNKNAQVHNHEGAAFRAGSITNLPYPPIHAVLCIGFSAAAAHGASLATLLTMTAMVPIISLLWYGAVGI